MLDDGTYTYAKAEVGANHYFKIQGDLGAEEIRKMIYQQEPPTQPPISVLLHSPTNS